LSAPDGAVLTAKGVRWARTGHPWVYRDDLRACAAEPGAIVPVRRPDGGVLGWGAYSGRSKIALRFVSRGPDAPGAGLLRERLERAAAFRAQVVRDATAYRLVSSEPDGLPGLVVDRYGEVFSLQTACPVAEAWKEEVADWLVERFAPRAIVERNEGAVRDLEGLPRRSGVLRGALPEEVWVEEAGVRYRVDVLGGQKTGAFLDQRENRVRLREFASGTVLDAFAYEGLFALNALAGGAERVVCVESAARCEEGARRNFAASGREDRVEWVRANAFDFLRQTERAFDLVVLDPPAFAKNRGEISDALRGYREINLRALGALRPGGFLITSSCSSNVRPEDFLEVLRLAAGDAGRRVLLVEFRGQAKDHPILLNLPESRYLKSLFLQVL
jgi:23S rRNA (cytosine1962-C5)-methyltransferase